MFAHNPGDAWIIQVEGVPETTSIVGLGVHKDGLRGALVELVVRVFEEVAGIEQDLHPRRIDGLDNPQKALRCSRQAPVVFQTEDYAGLLGRGQAFFDTVDYPFEAGFIGVPGQRRFDAAILHQVVEALARSPGSGVEAYDGYAEFVCQVDTLCGVVDVSLPVFFVGREEALMDGHAAQVDAVDKGTAFEVLEVIVGLAGHLPMQYLDAVKTHPCGFFDAGFNRQLQVSLESPERIRRDGYGIRPP